MITDLPGTSFWSELNNNNNKSALKILRNGKKGIVRI